MSNEIRKVCVSTTMVNHSLLSLPSNSCLVHSYSSNNCTVLIYRQFTSCFYGSPVGPVCFWENLYARSHTLVNMNRKLLCPIISCLISWKLLPLCFLFLNVLFSLAISSIHCFFSLYLYRRNVNWKIKLSKNQWNIN